MSFYYIVYESAQVVLKLRFVLRPHGLYASQSV
jgi:hypothetical protein